MATNNEGNEPRFGRRAWPKLCNLANEHCKGRQTGEGPADLSVMARYFKAFPGEEAAALSKAFEAFAPTEADWDRLLKLERDVRMALDPRAKKNRAASMERLQKFIEKMPPKWSAVVDLIQAYAACIRAPGDATIEFTPHSGVALCWPVDETRQTLVKATLEAGFPVVFYRPAVDLTLPPQVIEPESLDVTVPPAAVDATVKVEETEGKAAVADAADAVPADFLTQVRQSMTDLGDVVFGRILLDRWPMLRRFAADAVVLLPNRPAEEGQKPEEQAVQLLLETHARALFEKERDAYVVLAAESLGSDDHPGVMAFVICPPGTDLPLLAPGQQAAKDPAFVLKAVEALCERPEISAFLFVESGHKKHEALSKRKGPFCRSAELLANWVAHRAKEPVVKVDLYVLATRGAAPGATLAAKAFGQLRNHIPAFKAPGSRLQGPDVIASDEHGWLGYAEALSFLSRCTWNARSERLRQTLMERENTLELPFDSYVLEDLRGLIHRTEKPNLEFLQAVCRLSNRYMAAIGSMLEGAIERAIVTLNSEEWATICEECRASLLRDSAYSRAIGTLVDKVDALPALPEALFGPVAFDYLDTVMAVARLRQDADLAESAIARWEKLRADHLEPLPEVGHLFELRRAELECDSFAFSKTLARVEDRLNDEDCDDEEVSLLTLCRVQALAHLEHPVLATELLEELNAQDDVLEPEANDLRLCHLWYDRARLANDMDALEAAYDAAVYATGANSRRDSETILQGCEQSPHVAAALAKVLAAFPLEDRPDYAPQLFAKERLRRRAPFEMLAFWGAVMLYDYPDEALRQRSRSLARFMMSLIPHRMVDAPAVRFLCYQRALRHIGLLRKDDLVLDYNTVYANASPTTQAWLDDYWIHAPRNLHDCLAPLTYRFR